MLHILLFILKLCGILLLSMLGIFLLFICCILFVPVTYRLNIKKQNQIFVYLRAGWLFSVFRLDYQLQSNTSEEEDWQEKFILRFFGIPIFKPLEEETEAEKRKKKKPKRKKQKKQSGRTQEKTEKKVKNTQTEASSKATVTEKPKQQEIKTKKQIDLSNEKNQQKEEKKEKKNSMFSKFWKKLKSVLKSIPKSFRNLKGKRELLFEFWNKEEHRLARTAIYQNFRLFWKKSKPKKIKGNIHFGMEDPCETGLVLGFLSILQSLYKNELSIEADFEQQRLEGEVLIRGNIFIYIFLRSFLRIYFDKNIRTMYHNWNKLSF